MEGTSAALAYVRYSTDQQSEGDSYRRQRELAEKVAIQRNLKIIEWVEDLGVSAYRGSHIETGNLGKLLDRVHAGLIEKGTYLLFENFDRLSRLHVFDSTRVLLDLYDAGLTLITTSDNTAHGRDQGLLGLLRPMLEGERAHSESVAKAGRIADAWKEKRAKALEGVKMTSRIPAWLKAIKDDRGRLIDFEEIPDRAALVMQIYTDAANGMGKFSIAARLNAAGVKSWGGDSGWYPSYIHKILTNRAVIGEFQPHRKIATKFDPKTRRSVDGRRVAEGEAISGYYPVIVPLALWERTRAARSERRGKGGRKGKALRNLFSGLCRCSECDSVMTLRHPGDGPKAGRDYLICDRALRKAGCSNKSKHYYEEVEGPILEHLSELLFDPADIASKTSEISEAENVIAALVHLRAVKQAEIARLIDAIASGDSPYFAEAIKSRETEIDSAKIKEAAARARLEELRGRTSTSERKAVLKELRDDLGSDEQSIRFLARSRLSQELRSVISRMVFEGDLFWISVAGGLRYYQFGHGQLMLFDKWSETETGPQTDQQKRFFERIVRIQKTDPQMLLDGVREAFENARRVGNTIEVKIPKDVWAALMVYRQSQTEP